MGPSVFGGLGDEPRRRISPRANEPERERLPKSFWADYKLDSYAGCEDEEPLLVVKRAPLQLPTWLREGVPPGLNRGRTLTSSSVRRTSV